MPIRRFKPPVLRAPGQLLVAAALLSGSLRIAGQAASPDDPSSRIFSEDVRPLVQTYCLNCHSTEKQKGELDLERFTSLSEVVRQPKPWQSVAEQLADREMPPKDKPQPSDDERRRLLDGVNALLDAAALARAGDPGPVVLRRLNNAEYTYTLRDLTGVESLDPAAEFPTDSASGEGFMNVGNSLVMSPALVTKYLDAAKEIANHAMLLPDGIAFSPSTSRRDWTEEKLAAIRSFYGRFSENGGGTAVNLQGIKFDTKDGGVLPLEEYLAATIELRGAPDTTRLKATPPIDRIRELAAQRGLSPKYLTLLWNAFNATDSSPLLDPVRAQWRSAQSEDVAALAQSIATWQHALWRFTTVGHIGKRDGPPAWQVPVTPLAEAREVRLKFAPDKNTEAVTLYLTAGDAGDGNQNDFALWENPRLVAPGRPDLPLREVRAAVDRLSAFRQLVFESTEKCLAAAAEVTGSLSPEETIQLANRHGIEPAALKAWLNCLGIGAGETRIENYITGQTERAESYDFIKGWTGADALSVLANSSDQHVRVPGNMKPHGVAVHPSPTRKVIISWRSPVTATLGVEGAVQHAHPECGNGVTWAIELHRGPTRQRLAAGTAQGSKAVPFGPLAGVSVQAGDVISIAIGPRDGNHSCDLTAVDLKLSDGTRTWDLAQDVAPDILAGNPHADRLGNAGVWHFHSEPDQVGGPETVLPAGSLLAKWQGAASAEEKRPFAAALQTLFQNGAQDLAANSPDAVLMRQMTSLNGPLLSSLLRTGQSAAAQDPRGSETKPLGAVVTNWGLDPSLFGKHPSTGSVDPNSLCVQAPSVIEVRLPAELVAGAEFVTTTRLHPGTATEGSVQMQVLTTKPGSVGLAAGAVQSSGGKGTWSDGERPVISDAPILVNEGTATRQRFAGALEEFRQLFPAALCYTKIVPVDEVVTLTLFYREDDQLRRLMLDDRQAAELDRLWSELHYVSLDAFKLVDAFEQLWQFATQDADPSAFEPLREPIKQRAEVFRKLLLDTQPAHLDAVLTFAEGAYRRPLTETDRNELGGLYQKLRNEEIGHEEAIRLTLARVLVSPSFLYKLEQPPPGKVPGLVNDWELATRLSYFLWSSAPDAELRALAAAGRLREPDVLAAQARRMLKDPRTRRLATEFACAWLHVYDFDELGEKSERHFPTFTSLRGAMYEETIRFFTDLFQHDGSVLDILDANYLFVNEELAKHYGIPDSARPDRAGDNGWQRVDGARQFHRGGILAQATTLAKQSGASRTSPILRGNWLAEVLLGEKLPRPPANVPQLPEDEATETLTVRQLTEKHSTDPKCFGCHRRIDPYGYSLEAYDAIGRFRDRDLGGRPIDVKTRVMDGTELEGLEGLRHYLLTTRRDAFLRQFCRKLLGYSLGRGVLLSDGPLIKEMREQLKQNDFKIGDAIENIVRSKQFREIRGKEMAGDD